MGNYSSQLVIKTQPTCCRHKQAAILHLKIFQLNHQEIPHSRRVQQCRVTKLCTAWEHPMNLAAMDTIILLLIQHRYDTYIFCHFFSPFLILETSSSRLIFMPATKLLFFLILIFNHFFAIFCRGGEKMPYQLFSISYLN